MCTVVPEICNVSTTPHIQATISNWTYLRCYWRYLDNSIGVILQTLSPTQRTPSSTRYVNSGPAHIQSIYSSAYSDYNIKLNVSALLLQISRLFHARYNANLVSNIAHILQFTPCELWSRPYTRYLHFRIFRFRYSTEGSSPAIGGISTIQCALCFKLGATYSAHPPVYPMWNVVLVIYKVLKAPHIYASIFDGTYLRCYWR
jgi:hypothetical protein